MFFMTRKGFSKALLLFFPIFFSGALGQEAGQDEETDLEVQSGVNEGEGHQEFEEHGQNNTSSPEVKKTGHKKRKPLPHKKRGGGDGSLFLTPEEQQDLEDRSIGPKKGGEEVEAPLVLGAILRRPDLGQWTVWINGTRIESLRPICLHGWRIVVVEDDHVVLVNAKGEEKTLYVSSSPFFGSDQKEGDGEDRDKAP